MSRQIWSAWIGAAMALAVAVFVILPRLRPLDGGPGVGVAAEADAAVVKRVYTSPLGERGWYAKDRAGLLDQIKTMVSAVKDEPRAQVQALILPHAGYRWAGPTAAYGVKQIQGKRYARVIVMGPTHRLGLENAVSVPEYTHYRTPLGDVPLDQAFLRALKAYAMVVTNPRAHDGEHSVQIEVPWLQYALGSFKLVPMVVGQLDNAAALNLAKILNGLIDEQTLVVASSDFTHYGPRFSYEPFTEDIPAQLKKLDLGAYKFIAQKEAVGFAEYCDKTGATICGRDAIKVLLAMLPKTSQAHLLHYDTSGRVSGDYTQSVSYLSAAFTGTWPRGKAVDQLAAGSLTAADKQALLKLARDAITFALKHGKVPSEKDLGFTPTPGSKRVMGAFVTLHKRGRLRGCIGEIFPRRPLYRAVLSQAINAAFRDTRFPQVEADELADLHIEISALTPPHPVKSYNDIVIGKHGMVLHKAGRSAVFLPQVAPEQKWDLATTLTHLARKAGLPAQAWKQGATFTVFEAIVFSEPKKNKDS